MSLTKKRLNANQIKLIAIIAMTVDHLTWAFFPGTQAVWYVFALHIIGRGLLLYPQYLEVRRQAVHLCLSFSFCL